MRTLIVGGTRGLGKSVAAHFAKGGHRVDIVGRTADAAGDKIHARKLDLADRDAVAKTLKSLLAETEPLNNIIFCQRFRGDGDSWAGELAVSLTATKDIVEAFGQSAKGPASIVLVSTAVFQSVADGQPAGYHVVKAALWELARYYAVALGPKGIRVNCVSPCTMLKDESKDFYLKNASLTALYERIVPIGRLPSTEDVVPVIDFLCGPASRFVTGQNVVVDGGMSLRWPESVARSLHDEASEKKS